MYLRCYFGSFVHVPALSGVVHSNNDCLHDWELNSTCYIYGTGIFIITRGCHFQIPSDMEPDIMVDGIFFWVFCPLILRGDPLGQRLLSRGPTESLQHTHTHIQLHTTQSPAITNNQVLYTHTVWSVAALFFQVVQGCRAGFEPRTSHSSCSASSLTATEPPLHPINISRQRLISGLQSQLCRESPATKRILKVVQLSII